MSDAEAEPIHLGIMFQPNPDSPSVPSATSDGSRKRSAGDRPTDVPSVSRRRRLTNPDSASFMRPSFPSTCCLNGIVQPPVPACLLQSPQAFEHLGAISSSASPLPPIYRPQVIAPQMHAQMAAMPSTSSVNTMQNRANSYYLNPGYENSRLSSQDLGVDQPPSAHMGLPLMGLRLPITPVSYTSQQQPEMHQPRFSATPSSVAHSHSHNLSDTAYVRHGHQVNANNQWDMASTIPSGYPDLVRGYETREASSRIELLLSRVRQVAVQAAAQAAAQTTAHLIAAHNHAHGSAYIEPSRASEMHTINSQSRAFIEPSRASERSMHTISSQSRDFIEPSRASDRSMHTISSQSRDFLPPSRAFERSMHTTSSQSRDFLPPSRAFERSMHTTSSQSRDFLRPSRAFEMPSMDTISSQSRVDGPVAIPSLATRWAARRGGPDSESLPGYIAPDLASVASGDIPFRAWEAAVLQIFDRIPHMNLMRIPPKGMPKSEIDQLKSFRLMDPSVIKEKVCVVCQCDFERRDHIRVLPCDHHYHTRCVDKWLKTNRTCPICRQSASMSIDGSPSAANPSSRVAPPQISVQVITHIGGPSPPTVFSPPL